MNCSQPSNVIAFPSQRPCSPLDDGKAFARLYHAAMIAKAEYELIEARWSAEHFLQPVGHYSPLWPQRLPAFAAMLQAVTAMAMHPARTRAEINMKKRAIGPAWMCAEGEIYDRFREQIARDELCVANSRGVRA